MNPMLEADLEAKLGVILGACADGPVDDPAQVLAGMRGTIAKHHDTDRASLVMVGGRVLVRERRLVEADEAAITARVDAATSRLIAAASKSTAIDYDLFQ